MVVAPGTWLVARLRPTLHRAHFPVSSAKVSYWRVRREPPGRSRREPHCGLCRKSSRRGPSDVGSTADSWSPDAFKEQISHQGRAGSNRSDKFRARLACAAAPVRHVRQCVLYVSQKDRHANTGSHAPMVCKTPLLRRPRRLMYGAGGWSEPQKHQFVGNVLYSRQRRGPVFRGQRKNFAGGVMLKSKL